MTITEYEIKTRPLSSRVSAKLDCPHCNEPLTVDEDDIGHPDRCPTCNTGFQLSHKPLREYRTTEASNKKAKAKAKTEAERTRVDARESRRVAEAERRKDERRRERVVSESSTSDKLSSIASVMAAVSRVLMYVCLAVAVVLLMAAMAAASSPHSGIGTSSRGLWTHLLMAMSFLLWIGPPLLSAFFFGLCRVGCLAALKSSE